ncbi:PfpI endopeptidase-like protein [Glonium stellatum]|uniref:PfpI endopeptidase-like protein n=1 Tax=Glonium stellatum TaxID=574774 RepID=A0A8E2ERF6_9PEZI|nr:PfpI endopeptidase-like protein [Glonium stellatum]
MTAMDSSKPVRIGVFVVPPIQLLDFSPVDLFNMLTKEYLTACNLPSPLVALAIPISITYISFDGANSIAPCTANVGLRINAGLSDAGVQPGELDILLIPGPDPNMIPREEELEFVRKHVAAGVTLMTVCTGVFVAGYSGVLDGKKVTGPRQIVSMMLKKFPKAEWSEKRWVQDGKIWTSGGITNGQDMVAAYIRQRWPGPVTAVVCEMADIGSRDMEYNNGSTKDNAWWIWQIFRAWTMGFWKTK